MQVHSKVVTNGGFTLIELLVVIAIISLLASVVMTSLTGARMKARDVRRKADLRELAIAAQLYYENNNGQYPRNGSSIDGDWVVGFQQELAPYMKPVPKDPINDVYAHSYTAARMSWGTTPEQIACNGYYVLWGFLEDPNDPEQGKHTCGWGGSHYFVILEKY